MINTGFANNLNAQFQRIAAMHPQLLDAVPPEPIQRRSGTFRLSVAEFWPDFCAREWQPRTGDDANLIGPFHMYGECLDPFIRSGELHWYDPTLPARDGDVVLVQWDPTVLEDMYARNSGDATWMTQYGEPAPIATKIYKTVGPNQWLLTRKSMSALGANKILGVLRKRVVEGVDASAVRVSLIEQNAATELYSVSDSGPDTYTVVTVPSPPTGYISVALPAIQSGYVIRATLTTSMKVSTGGDICQASLQLYYSGGSMAGDLIDCYDTLEQSYTAQAEFTPPVGLTSTLIMNINTSGTATWRQSRIQAEIVKR